MISKDRSIEVVEYALANGEEACLAAYNIPRDTYTRYLREYKKHFGDNADLLLSLKKRYTKEELASIVKGESVVDRGHRSPKLSFDVDTVTFGIMTDTHIGSIFTHEDYIVQGLQEMEKAGCSFLIHAGDSVEGMMNRPNAIYELNHIGYKAQRDAAVDLLKGWTKPLYMVGGNHNASFDMKFGVGMDITEDICSRLPDATYLGSCDGTMDINGVATTVFHGNDGSSYALSYREQRIIDMMQPVEMPQLLITGHVHKAFYCMYRGVHIICGGTLQSQTPFMRGKKLPAHVGWWVVKAGISDGIIRWIEPRWYSCE